MSLNVFIADDSQILRTHLRTMLTEIPGVVIVGEAENTSEAIERILNEKPDVAILDIRMPGEGGIFVLKMIKKSLKETIVIIFTDYPYPQYRTKCMEEGADYFFDKATESEELIDLIKKLKTDKNHDSASQTIPSRGLYMIVNVNHFFSFLKRIRLEKIGGFESVIVPEKSEKGDLFFTEVNGETSVELDTFRTIDPLKMLFYFPREEVLPNSRKPAKRMILGVKNCDLMGLKVTDKALINNDFVDPAYFQWRENTTIVSVDCTQITGACHCNLVNGKPYAEEYFDLNMSRIGSDYRIESCSSKGDDLVELLKSHIPYSEDTPEAIQKVQTIRKNVMHLLENQNKKYVRTDDYEHLKRADLQKWIDESKTCVGCGGCTNICPTCYCLILNDETTSNDFVKVRSYDSCQVHGYAKVAGGATPRPKMYERFRNRYLCKLSIMKENFDLLGCTGCGRCIDVCPGRIEFREVVQKMTEPSKVQE